VHAVRLWNGKEVPVGKIVALGKNYADHAKEMGGQVPKQPMLFLKPATSIIHEGEAVEYPPHTQNLHYEIELGVVIGKQAKRIKAADWKQYVLGYVTLLDMTARDLQKDAQTKGEPWSVAKGFDTFCPIGTAVDAAKVADPHALALELKVNGEVKQKGNTKDLVFKLPTILEYVSHVFTLEPGDIIATGTPEGVGPVKPGDVLEAKIGGVGTLKVRVEKRTA